MPEYPIIRHDHVDNTIGISDIRNSNWGKINPHLTFSQPVSLGVHQFTGGDRRAPVPANEPSLGLYRDIINTANNINNTRV